MMRSQKGAAWRPAVGIGYATLKLTGGGGYSYKNKSVGDEVLKTGRVKALFSHNFIWFNKFRLKIRFQIWLFSFIFIMQRVWVQIIYNRRVSECLGWIKIIVSTEMERILPIELFEFNVWKVHINAERTKSLVMYNFPLIRRTLRVGEYVHTRAQGIYVYREL